MDIKRHIFERGVDLLLDTRLPHAAPHTLWRRWRYPRVTNEAPPYTPLMLCLTFDVEHDFRDPAGSASAKRFLQRLGDWLGRHDWPTTLYVQGSIVPALAPQLVALGSSHELGLHGMHHEVWGRSRWWQYRLGLTSLPIAERRARLLQALQAFREAGLPQPRAFRAPYLNIDRASLRLLSEHGFTSDSSPAAYLGALPVPTRYRHIWQIPVSANPRPDQAGVMARYADLTIGGIATLAREELLATVRAVVDAQRAANAPRHLVLLAHPWEFERTAGVAHSSAENWDRLADAISAIAAAYRATFTTITGLVERLNGFAPIGAHATKTETVA